MVCDLIEGKKKRDSEALGDPQGFSYFHLFQKSGFG